MKTVVLYNIISFIILVALIFVLRIVSKSNLRQNQQLVIKVIATILIVCVIAFALFIDAIAFGIIGPVQD
jgi:putative copper export protein